MSPSAATAIVARTAGPDGGAELTLRAEALTPQAAARTGLLAWEMRLAVDCRRRLVKPGETAGYTARTPDGEPIPVAPAKADWSAPVPGTALESAWRAVCDPGFRPPLASPPARLAQTSPAPAAPPVASAAASVARDAAAPIATASAPVRRGLRAAQVVSSPEQADTARSLAALRSRFGAQLAGLETRIEPAQVRGRTVYRGVVAGFASRDAASAFCEALRSRGQDCLAR